MKWHKLGKIFDPRDFELVANCNEFAQSPQALVFDSFVRIYFSTREKDILTGKYLSHVFFADFDKNFKCILNVSSRATIGLGKRGCFDEHGIFPLNPLWHDGRVLAYTCGWSRRVSVSVETAIGLAESNDKGATFERLGDGPVLCSSPNEPHLVGDPFVRVYKGVFHMWYIFGTAWKEFIPGHPPDRVYKIGHATSTDGIRWKKEEGRQIIADKLSQDECQALPTVIDISGRYHMFFCYREAYDFRSNKERAYRIGHASSTDLDNWVRDDGELGIGLSDSGWDSEMMCYPNVFECDKRIYMLYNGNEFGRYGFGLAILT